MKKCAHDKRMKINMNQRNKICGKTVCKLRITIIPKKSEFILFQNIRGR